MKRLRVLGFIFLFLALILIILGCIFLFTKEESIDSTESIYGYYVEESGMLFYIGKDKFIWYKDYNNKDNNYYEGKSTISSLCDYQLTNKEIEENYGDISCKQYYDISFNIKKLVSDNKKETYDDNYTIDFALYFEDDVTTILYNFNEEKQYYIAKIDNF